MKPLLFLLTLTSLTTFGQAPDTTQPLRHFEKTLWASGGSTLTIIPGQNGEPDLLTLDIKMRPRYDTLRAKLLVTYTTRRWGIAHARDGFVVLRAGDLIAFYTDMMESFPPNTELWGWRKHNKKFKKSKHGRN